MGLTELPYMKYLLLNFMDIGLSMTAWLSMRGAQAVTSGDFFWRLRTFPEGFYVQDPLKPGSNRVAHIHEICV